jgi:hypothetical protein
LIQGLSDQSCLFAFQILHACYFRPSQETLPLQQGAYFLDQQHNEHICFKAKVQAKKVQNMFTIWIINIVFISWIVDDSFVLKGALWIPLAGQKGEIASTVELGAAHGDARHSDGLHTWATYIEETYSEGAAS